MGWYIKENEFFLLQSVTRIFKMIHPVPPLFNLTSVLLRVCESIWDIRLRNVLPFWRHNMHLLWLNEIGFNKSINIWVVSERILLDQLSLMGASLPTNEFYMYWRSCNIIQNAPDAAIITFLPKSLHGIIIWLISQ